LDLNLNSIPNGFDTGNSARQLIGKEPCTVTFDRTSEGDNTFLHGRMDALDRISDEALLNVDLNVIVVLPERGLRKKKYGSGKEKVQSQMDCPPQFRRNERTESRENLTRYSFEMGS
jgi:hypothetical protein